MLSKTITKKGTSNFVLMPKDFLDNLGLKTGDKVDVKMEGDKIVITPAKETEVK
jgi:AbrB family looped-hinge helix DNA binding protein